MYGAHVPMISEVSGVPWVVMATALVVMAVAAIRSVARLRLLDGRGESNLGPSERFKLNSAVDVALACFDLGRPHWQSPRPQAEFRGPELSSDP